MLREVLSLGDKIDIRLLDHMSKPHMGRTLVSQLIDFIDLDVIHIAAPIVYGRTILLQVGDSYNLCFYTEKGLYHCNCTVLNNHKDNKTVITTVRIVTNLEKFQRRQYYRMECIHDIEYRIITTEEKILLQRLSSGEKISEEERNEISTRLKQLESKWISGMITNISGGGAKFNSDHQHNQGDKLLINLSFMPIGDTRGMLLKARMISTGKILTRVGAFEHGIEFIDIDQKDRETLIKFIFEQERIRRRNELS